MSLAEGSTDPRLDPTVSDAVALQVDATDLRWSDVVAYAVREGAWEVFTTELRQAVACRRLVAEQGPRLDRATERDVATAFRRARRLLAAEDLEAWLAARDVTVRAWQEYVRAEGLRRRHAHELPELVVRFPATDEQLRTLRPVWGWCTGALPRWAEQVAVRVAAAHALDGPGSVAVPLDDTELAALAERHERFAEAAASPARLGALIASRYLDWVRIDADLATFSTVDRAREARLCVTDDGWTLAQATRAGRGSLQRRSLLVEDLPTEVRHEVVRAHEEELLGPLALAEGPTLLWVRGKHRPSDDDAEVRRRATDELVTTATSRELDARVTWLHPRDRV